tara:strand:- start:223 stop:432 length:210 start_codon:yes stop_codon:yes gene_type:complete
MRYDPNSLAMQQLKKCVEHLESVCQVADEDCPSRYRTKWFNPTIQDAYDYIDNLYKQGILTTEGRDDDD